MKDRKVTYLQKQISKLNNQIKEIKSENDALTIKNQSLEKDNLAMRDSVKNLNQKLQDIQVKYDLYLSEAKKYKQQYEEILKSARLMKSKYEKEFRMLIQKTKIKR